MAKDTATFADHVSELRSRLMWTLLFVAIGAGIGYAMHDTILQVLQRPLNDTLYYNTPTGAFSFVVKICCAFGFVVALPMAVYQIFGFFEPLLALRTRRLFVTYVGISTLLAGAGMLFAYIVSLPAALHFLVNFGNDSGSIKALITANEYFNFVISYIVGFAVLFQIPLIVAFINRITPLTPRKLVSATRYVIVISFIVAAILTPTPDPVNQFLMAAPILVLYTLSIVIVAIANRARRPQARPLSTGNLPHYLFDDGKPAAMKRSVGPGQPVQQKLSATAMRPAAANRSVVSDMVVPRRSFAPTQNVQPLQTRRRPASQPRAQQPMRPIKLEAPTIAPVRRRPAMGVISDFIPATD